MREIVLENSVQIFLMMMQMCRRWRQISRTFASDEVMLTRHSIEIPARNFDKQPTT